jgi:two-component system sensor histidine kinase HydH
MHKPKAFLHVSPADTDAPDARERGAAQSETIGLTTSRKTKLAWVDAREIIDKVCADLQHSFAAAGIDTTIDVPRQALVWADRQMLSSAITSLATNALEAMPQGGRLVITSYCGAKGFELEVGDSGPGLSEESLKRAFEPFYSTKRDRAGLGLAVVRRIAQAHQGEVVAMNCPEGGAAFTLRIPNRASEAAA